MGAFNNFRAAWKGIGSFGKALKLEKKGDEKQALQLVRRGLDALASQGVNRHTPHTSSVLIQLTAMCERLSHKLNEPGASKNDLEDAYINISRIYENKEHEYHEFLQYIEVKLGYAPSQK